VDEGFDGELEGQAVGFVGLRTATLKVLLFVDGGNKEREGKPFDHPREVLHESGADARIEQHVERARCKPYLAAMEVYALVVPVTKLETRQLRQDNVAISGR